MQDSCLLVIFGASGDLTARKLMPALYHLCKENLLPKPFAVLGVGRTPGQDDYLRVKINEGLKSELEDSGNTSPLDTFTSMLHYHSMDPFNAEDYSGLRARIDSIRQEKNLSGNIIYYLSTPPNLYPVIPVHLAQAGLNKETDGYKRLVVEKPFGTNLETSRTLNQVLHEHFGEEQIYRIDHYLGKETVQNILVFRLGNDIFDSLWNHRYVDYVEVTAAENIGVENRGGYYEQSGVIRDMIQNHLLQIVAMIAMEPPNSFDSLAVRNETMKVFQCLKPLNSETLFRDVVLGQYVASHIKGKAVPGYREEKGVSPHSRTETYAAFKLMIENSRWHNTPFFIRTGKRMPTRVTEVVIHFKKTPHPAFGPFVNQMNAANQLILRIQPDDGIQLKFGMKLPGAGFNIKPVNMNFHYRDLSDSYIPSAYERLLMDCMSGDSTLYARSDAVDACWNYLEPLLKYKEEGAPKIFGYPAGSWGPREADVLISSSGKIWRYPCKNLTQEDNYCEL